MTSVSGLGELECSLKGFDVVWTGFHHCPHRGQGQPFGQWLAVPQPEAYEQGYPLLSEDARGGEAERAAALARIRERILSRADWSHDPKAANPAKRYCGECKGRYDGMLLRLKHGVGCQLEGQVER